MALAVCVDILWPWRCLGDDIARVLAGAGRLVGDVEPTVDAHDEVHEDDDDLNGKVKDVEAGLGKVPRLSVAQQSLGQPISASAEGGAESEEGGGKDKDDDFCPEAAGAELVDVGASGNGEHDEDDGDGEEGDAGEACQTVELDVPVDAERVCVCRKGRLDADDNDHEEGDDGDGNSDGWDENLKGLAPADVGVSGAHEALGEEEVDDEQDDDAGLDKDVCGDGQVDIVGIVGPYDTEYSGDDTDLAEAWVKISMTSEQGRGGGPNMAPEKTNLWLFFLLPRKSLKCMPPAMMKRARKTAETGTSGMGVGGLPRL